MPESLSTKGSPSTLLAVLLALLVLSVMVVVLLPVWLIQPFKPQSSGALAWSFWLRRWSPMFTIGALLAGGVLAGVLWQGVRSPWRKALIACALFPLVLSVWASRQNHFEWMFAPLPNSSFERAVRTDFVSPSDLVLGIKVKEDAVAFPVRQVAYHHLVQDDAGGVPIVATF